MINFVFEPVQSLLEELLSLRDLRNLVILGFYEFLNVFGAQDEFLEGGN